MDIKKKLTTGKLDLKLSEGLKFLGYQYTQGTITDNLVRWMNVFPFAVKHFHCLSMGAGGLGKGYIPCEFFKKRKNIHSSTLPQLFGNVHGNLGFLNENHDTITFDECANFGKKNTEEIESAIKTYMGETPVIRCGNTEPYNNAPSLIFIGNTDDNYQYQLNESPYNYSRKFYKILPEFFHEDSVKERLVKFPFWMCSKLEKGYLTKEYLAYRDDFLDYVSHLRQDSLTINVSENNVRDLKKYQKIITGFLLTLYDSNYTKDDLEELEAFSKFIVDLSYGRYKEFYTTQAGKRFALRLALAYLNDDIKIEKVFFDKNRILIKEEGQPLYIKLALNKYGIEDSKKELEFFEKNKNYNNIAKIISLSSNGLIMKQDYYPLEGSLSELKDLSFLSPLSPNSEVESLKKLVISLTNRIEELELKHLSTGSTVNNLIKYSIDLSNCVPAKFPEFIEIKTPLDKDKSKDSFKRLISKTLKIPKDNIKNHHLGISENGEFRLVNFGDIINL